MSKLRQVQLKSGQIGMTTWVDDKPKLKEGAVITLKTYIEPDRRWSVEKLYDMILEEKDFVRNYKNDDTRKHPGLWAQAK